MTAKSVRFSRLSTRLLDRLGDWNPQLVRELQGRLKPRSVALVTAVSILCQLLLMFVFWVELPEAGAKVSRYNPYGIPGPEGILAGIRWEVWWQDIFQTLNVILPAALILIGVYMLINDLATEEQRGTLNFIRLTPQSSQKILTGKLLGTPVLLYLALATALPLHIWAAQSGAVPINYLITFYLFTGAIALAFYTVALLLPVLGLNQAWLGATLASMAVFPLSAVSFHLMETALKHQELFRVLSEAGLTQAYWFFVPLGANFWLITGFFFLSFLVINYWVWQAVNRRFRNPNASAITKAQSYLIFAGLQVWLIGFVWSDFDQSFSGEQLTWQLFSAAGIYYLFILMPMLALGLLAAVSPSRQSLQDWARYYHKNHVTQKGFWNRALVRELIWGEKSPVVIAMGINLGIVALCWMPWLAILMMKLGVNGPEMLQMLAGLTLTLSFILICAVVAQLVLFVKARKPSVWAIGSVVALVALPPMTLGILGLTPESRPEFWLVTGFPFYSVFNTSITMTLVAVLAQGSILSVLGFRLVKKLQKVGASESKALMAGS